MHTQWVSSMSSLVSKANFNAADETGIIASALSCQYRQLPRIYYCSMRESLKGRVPLLGVVDTGRSIDLDLPCEERISTLLYSFD